ncbi:universal stress protein [Devriesea agamarum]|uniref:universal stress protein n=1 Tax=Devriesea agamarum TaxID=472569 RepID=UPI00071E155A|nr:universal stress protein [Devriesea agamarum]
MIQDNPRIVVGVTESDGSERALKFAAHHARLTGGRLHLVHAFIWPLMNVDIDPVPGIAGSGLRVAAEQLLAETVEQARQLVPEHEITSELVVGRPAEILLQQSASADLLVVGGRGLGRFMSLVVGSVSLALASGAHCPVVVVRGEETGSGPVAAAFDGTSFSERALRAAAHLATMHGVGVQVVHGAAVAEAGVEHVLERARQVVHEESPGVEVTMGAPVTGRSAQDLIKASSGARMLVTAPHDRTQTASAMSSVTMAILRYAHTPVWLARPNL